MGARVFYGTQVKIVLNSMDTAVNFYYDGANWATYLKHLWIESGLEKGEYVDVASLLGLKVDGRMEVFEYEVYFYKIDGENLTLYLLEDGQLYVLTGNRYSSEEGIFIQDYHFVRKGTILTYHDDENNVLTINTNYTRDEYDYVYNGTFNGREAQIIANNAAIKTTLGDTTYTFTLNKNGTFTYTSKSSTYTKNYTASDGSNISVTFSSSSLIRIVGVLNGITTPNGSKLSTTVGWFGIPVGDNVYKVVTSYLANTYEIMFTLAETTFSYTYDTLTKINCRTPENNFIVVSVNARIEIRNVQIMFRLADNTLVTADSTYTEEDGYYLVTVDFLEEVINPDTGSMTRIPSPRNGVYKVTVNLTARTGTMTKLS